MIAGTPINVLDYGADPTGAEDCATAFAAAVAALPTTGGTLYIPDGDYTYSGGLIFNYPVSLVMGVHAYMNYTGTSHAVQLGAMGKSGADLGVYYVTGGRFIGGDNAIHGIYIPAWVAYPIIERVKFSDFGNTNGTSWGIFAQFQNWLIRVLDCTHGTGTKKSSFCAANGYLAGASGSYQGYDSGSSQLFAYGNNCTSSNIGGVGIFTRGAGSKIISNKIEGRVPNIIVSNAPGTTIASNYFEALTPGQPGGGEGHCITFNSDLEASVKHLVVENNYANMHQTDFGNTGSFLGPQDVDAKLEYCTVHHNAVVANNPSIPVVKLNNLVGQNDNSGTGNGASILRTNDSAIQAWSGEEAHELILSTGVSTPYDRIAKCKIVDSVVTLSSVLYTAGAVVPSGTVFATVPLGYEPSRSVTCAGYDGTTDTACAISINTEGEIKANVDLSAAPLYLDGVSFVR